jgi:hypothetical protein
LVSQIQQGILGVLALSSLQDCAYDLKEHIESRLDLLQVLITETIDELQEDLLRFAYFSDGLF